MRYWNLSLNLKVTVMTFIILNRILILFARVVAAFLMVKRSRLIHFGRQWRFYHGLL